MPRGRGHQGGAANQYETLGVLMYDQGFRTSMPGRASAIVWPMFALVLLIGLVNALITRRLRTSR